MVLDSAGRVTDSRGVNSRHFSTKVSLSSGSHVLLLDDTWTKGGHAQSAALALRESGATYVSVLVAARWIKEDFGNNAKFLRELPNRDYDPDICPRTGSTCP